MAKFLALLEVHDLKQHVTGATHVKGHKLDMMVSRGQPKVTEQCIGNSGSSLLDHKIIHFNLASTIRTVDKKIVQSRKLKAISIVDFKAMCLLPQ